MLNFSIEPLLSKKIRLSLSNIISGSVKSNLSIFENLKSPYIEFTYKIERSKLKKPLVMMEGTDSEYKIEYVTVAKSGNVEMCKPGRARTRGPMRKKSRRAEKRKAELKKKKSQMKKGVYGKKNNNKNKGNISKTAEFIGMERSALHRKLKSLGIKGIN